MFGLAIIHRELRVSARRKLTVWLRVLVGSMAGLFTFNILGYWPAGVEAPGKRVLQTLAWSGLVFCLVEGIRQTFDRISLEKRMGTLGLMLLTPQRGFDVVLGKMAAASLMTWTALLAIFPAMAIAFPAGGVTAGEFWRTQLALLNALFLVLACGLFVSARSYNGNRALAGAAALVTAICLLPPAAHQLTGSRLIPNISPAVALHLAEEGIYMPEPSRFWIAMLSMQVLGWGLLGLAGWKLETSTTEAAAEQGPPRFKREEGTAWRYRPAPSLHSRPRLRPSPLIDRFPAAWLANRFQGGGFLIWLAVVIVILADNWRFLPNWLSAAGPGFFMVFHLLSGFLSALLLAVAASRELAEARRNGALELLLCSPLPASEIVSGYWRALWSRLRLPLCVMIGALVLRMVNLVARTPFQGSGGPAHLVLESVLALTRIAGVFAACWLAMWFAVRTARSSQAIGLTLFWTVLAPWIGGQVYWLVARGLVPPVFTGGPPGWMLFTLLLWAMLQLIYMLLVIRWARNRLFKRLRGAVAGDLKGNRFGAADG